MARTRGAASRDAGGLYARTRSTVVAVARRLGDREDARCAVAVSALLCAFELALCVAIVVKVPYTEIDWRAYMDEVGGFLRGERDYTKLKGDTGPLVYPAGFVYLYAILRRGILRCADDDACADARDVRLAQFVFACVYVAHLLVTLATYRRAKGTTPPYALALLAMSKRIHSVFVLRMFNDGVASTFAHAAVLFAQRGRWPLAFFLFSLGTSVKMNVLLFLPPALVLVVGTTKPGVAVASVVVFVATQVALSAPFTFFSDYPREYLSRAFEFGRAFDYRWTVNWRFVTRAAFESRAFANALLLAHVLCLFAFAHGRWYRTTDDSARRTRRRRKEEEKEKERVPRVRFFWGFFADWFRRLRAGNASPTTSVRTALSDPAHVMSTLHEGAFIGVVFARSLHYQFYAWYFHSLPFLLWRCDAFDALAVSAFGTGTAFAVAASDAARVALLLTIERSWNVFPATEESSRTLFAAHAVLLVGLFVSRRAREKKNAR